MELVLGGTSPKVKRDEYSCPGCGRRTTDKTGRCIACRRLNTPRFVRSLTHDQLVELVKMCRSELQRRQIEIRSALDSDDARAR